MNSGVRKYPDISKKDFIDIFIAKFNVKPTVKPSAVFMAGLPGAGKTEFSERLADNIGSRTIRLDMDEIASEIKGYRPEKASQYREQATRLLNGVYDRVLKDRLEFIMDGTFGSKNAIKNIERAVNHGYLVKIIYIVQDPKLAWDFTLAREKIEHRAIDIDGFIKTYFNIIDNLTKIGLMMKKCDRITLDIIIKDDKNMIDSWIPNFRRDIDVLLKTSYNNETLKEYIDD